MIQGILDFLKLDSIVELNSLLKDKDIKEVLPQYNEIINQNIKREKFDYDNFLSPASIQKFRAINTENSVMMLNMWKGVKVWKPDKIK